MTQRSTPKRQRAAARSRQPRDLEPAAKRRGGPPRHRRESAAKGAGVLLQELLQKLARIELRLAQLVARIEAGVLPAPIDVPEVPAGEEDAPAPPIRIE